MDDAPKRSRFRASDILPERRRNPLLISCC
jgi:hypothetical protein